MEVLRNTKQPTCEGEAEKAEKEVYTTEITDEGDAPVFQQDDLPF
ncbi:hypothetical protein [Helicobacter rodentium]|nr:hypothetical protein [Helicobacter rodentium]